MVTLIFNIPLRFCRLTVHRIDAHWWGEGEFKFYLDGDTDYPTLCGTGAEDYACSAWGLGVHHAPYHGCPLYVHQHTEGPERDLNALVSYYRWHVHDPIYFHSDIKITAQQMGGAFVAQVRDRIENGTLEPVTPVQSGQEFVLFERQDDMSSVAFWYQTLPTLPFPPLPDRAIGLELRTEEKLTP